jgi:hypothetical protein
MTQSHFNRLPATAVDLQVEGKDVRAWEDASV